MKSRRVLITGGAGFIGTNLVKYLLCETDWEINILDNLNVGNFDNIKSLDRYDSKRVSFIEGDICNPKDIKKSLKGCQYVVHLAAQTGVIPSMRDPFKDADVNVLGTINTLFYSSETDVEKFIFSSSAAPLGEQSVPLDEKKVPLPISPYGASKLAGEGYCSAFAHSFGLPTVVLRFSNVYGPWSYQKGSVVATFCKQILQKKPVVIFGNGEQTRDFLYTENLCQAIHLAITTNLNNPYELFHIGTGSETSVNQLIRIMASIFEEEHGIETKTKYERARPGEIYNNYSNINKAQSGLGYKEPIPLEEGLTQTIRWFVNHHRQN